jgi:UDP-N-acetylmuramoyl-tripeptide--D-alanyl-D-alanine ligase
VDLRSRKLWARALLLRTFSRNRPLLYLLAAFAYVWRLLLFRTTFIAITGSLGKTTAKECLATILASRFPTARSFANRNSGIGVCLAVLSVRPWHRFAVFELSGAAPDNLRRAVQLVRPDMGILLNVLRTHTTTFPTLEDHAAEKMRLLEALPRGGIAFLNGEDPLVRAMANRPSLDVRLFGSSPHFDVWADQMSSRWPATLRFRAHVGSEVETVETQLIGTHWVPSVLAALAAACACGMSLRDAARAASRMEPFPARLQPVHLPSGAVVLRDDYNASIDTLDAACQVLREAEARRRLVVVHDFSDFGKNRKHRLRHLAAEAARSAEIALFIGEKAAYGRRRAIAAGIKPEDVHEFPSLKEATDFLRAELRAGDLMLLKGRTTDHAARVLLGQLHEVRCWKVYCRKTMLCEHCWELRDRGRETQRAPTV